jgi:2-polyprenyl-3-methyl-5-hydroxy-6-metoxy-1,4-benzoquinol methylase
MNRLANARDGMRRVLAQRHALPGRYRPERYWEARASELVHRYDGGPDLWQRIGWLRDGIEERLAVAWLRELSCSSVLVCGAGSGRQYPYLIDAGFSIEGFDIAPSLVMECNRRFADVRTILAPIADAHSYHEPHDAVLSTAVLQHVPPDQIAEALSALGGLARKAIVVRETTVLPHESSYQWAHDYRNELAGWEEFRRETTDEQDGRKVEMIAFRHAE